MFSRILCWRNLLHQWASTAIRQGIAVILKDTLHIQVNMLMVYSFYLLFSFRHCLFLDFSSLPSVYDSVIFLVLCFLFLYLVITPWSCLLCSLILFTFIHIFWSVYSYLHFFICFTLLFEMTTPYTCLLDSLLSLFLYISFCNVYLH